MKPDPIELIATALETFAQSLAAADNRATRIEQQLTDSALATEEIGSTLGSMAASLASLVAMQRTVSELVAGYATLERAIQDNTAIMQNFIQDTARLRASSQQLISEVRRKFADG